MLQRERAPTSWSDLCAAGMRGHSPELFDARDEQRRIIDEKDWVIARERERVVKELLARDGDLESHIVAASATLGVADAATDLHLDGALPRRGAHERAAG